MMDEHARLLRILRHSPEDYEPYGNTERTGADCSVGCRYAKKLAGNLGADWVVCTNPASHRVGMLTFEHQGCLRFEESR